MFDKELFVSPFIDDVSAVRLRDAGPGRACERLPCARPLREGQVLTAVLTADRMPLTGRGLVRAFFGYPLVTLKVIGGIHWEALKLWRKGAPYRRRGAPPAHPVTIHGAAAARRSAGVAS